MQIVDYAMKNSPSMLDICEHEKERQDCDICKKRLRDAQTQRLAALETALADIKENPTPRGPVPRKKWESA